MAENPPVNEMTHRMTHLKSLQKFLCIFIFNVDDLLGLYIRVLFEFYIGSLHVHIRIPPLSCLLKLKIHQISADRAFETPPTEIV